MISCMNVGWLSVCDKSGGRDETADNSPYHYPLYNLTILNDDLLFVEPSKWLDRHSFPTSESV